MRKHLLDVAAGRAAPDLVLKNGLVLNVFTKQFVQGDVAIAGGRVAGVGSYDGPCTRDCTGQWVVPGLIDAHMHIESTMAVPAALARAILPWGTTTLVADPHEIVNVRGAAGVRWLLEATEDLPLNVYVMLPSSVPATPFETNGADFTAADMAPLMAVPGAAACSGAGRWRRPPRPAAGGFSPGWDRSALRQTRFSSGSPRSPAPPHCRSPAPGR